MRPCDTPSLAWPVMESRAFRIAFLRKWHHNPPAKSEAACKFGSNAATALAAIDSIETWPYYPPANLANLPLEAKSIQGSYGKAKVEKELVTSSNFQVPKRPSLSKSRTKSIKSVILT